MIPKTVHYCWFGGKPLPLSVRRCIASWKKYLPDFEIKEWNESNFNVEIIPYTSEAYNIKKYAYTSDYARMWIIYHYGGVYFDTDVELIRPIYDILDKGAFMAFEKHQRNPEESIMVALGLGFAAQKNNFIIKEIMAYYENNHFISENGEICQVPIVPITTDVLVKYGLKESDIPVEVQGITIYTWEYFCPIEYLSDRLEITENTRSIHHYTESWMNWKDKLKMRKGAFFSKGIGKKIKSFLQK